MQVLFDKGERVVKLKVPEVRELKKAMETITNLVFVGALPEPKGLAELIKQAEENDNTISLSKQKQLFDSAGEAATK